MNLAPGTKLGPYEIVALIGAGGMGEVYRARDSRLKRDVAVKVLPKALSADADRLRRFEQEALATAALNHPNILAVFDIGSSDGAPYVVSELLEGETLRDLLRAGSIPQRKALDYASQVARGLASAHEKGIIHRDLKPENLFLTHDGRLKILDFGLAKLTQTEPGAQTSLATVSQGTEAGMVLGTAGYMSPEQVRGKTLDPRSDIFSFGAILYEMLSGKRAFHGDTPADTLSAILKEEPPDLSATNRNISPALERIVHHCLEKKPEGRFHSASDVAFDLEHLSGVSSSSTKTAQIEEAAPPKSNAIPGLAIAFAAVVIAFGLGWFGHRNTRALTQEYKQITFRMGTVGNARFTPDGSIVYSAIWEDGKLRLYMTRENDPSARELGIADAELLSISRNGELAVRENASVIGLGYIRLGTLARVSLSGGTPREVLDNVQDADWGPDGETLAVVHHIAANGHWRLEYPIGKVLFDSVGFISNAKISPDGKWIAFADHGNTEGDDEGSVAVIASDGSGKEKILSSGWESVQGILWPASSEEIWFSCARSGSADNPVAVTLAGKVKSITNVPGGIWLEDVRNGTVLMTSHQTRAGIRGVAPGEKVERELGWFGWSVLRDMSFDGRKVLFYEVGDAGGPNYTVFLRDTDGSPPSSMGEGAAEAISRDNKWVITKPPKGGPLNLVPTGPGQSRKLTHDSIDYGAVSWLPDNQHFLASGIEAGHGARDYLIDISTGDSKPVTPEGVLGVTVSPDGKNVAVINPEGKLGIWPLDGSGFHPIPGLDGSLSLIAWSGDGKSLYFSRGNGSEKSIMVYKVDIATGKFELWKSFGDAVSGTIESVVLSNDGAAYAYRYVQLTSQAYLATGLK